MTDNLKLPTTMTVAELLDEALAMDSRDKALRPDKVLSLFEEPNKPPSRHVLKGVRVTSETRLAAAVALAELERTYGDLLALPTTGIQGMGYAVRHAHRIKLLLEDAESIYYDLTQGGTKPDFSDKPKLAQAKLLLATIAQLGTAIPR